MEFELTAKQKTDRETFREFVNDQVIANADRYDAEERLPPELIAELAERGYMGAVLPENYGGSGMDMITYGLLNAELGRGCSSVRALVMLQNMVAQVIFRWGGKELASFWLPRLTAGGAIAAIALTEPNIGSDVKNIGTTAFEDGNDYILRGEKQWISFGQIADLFVVFCNCEGNLCSFLLERDTPGLAVLPIDGMLGMRASMLAELKLEECRVSKENMVGGMGFGLVPVAMDALNLGRYSIAWGSVGIAQACLDASIQHTGSRKQFGVYLKEHQLIQQMITDMMVNINAARLLCCKAGIARDRNDPDSVLDILSAKYFSTTKAVQAADNAVQIHGAMGCSSKLPVQRYLRDARIMEVIEGTTQIHQIKIAEYGYKKYERN